MKKEILHPDKNNSNFSTGAYSAAINVDGWLYISGQVAIDFSESKFKLGTIEEETHLTMHNIKRLCEAAGASLDHIIKCTVHLRDIGDFDRFNEVYAGYFKGVRPARTTVQSIMGHNIKVEIDAIVKLP